MLLSFLLQERRREYSLKSPGVKSQATTMSTRHNLVSSQPSYSSVINGSFSAGNSTSSLISSGSTLSSRRHVPSNLTTAANGGHLLNAVDDDVDGESLSSGATTPNTTPTTDSEFSMEDDTSSVFDPTISSSTSYGIFSSK